MFRPSLLAAAVMTVARPEVVVAVVAPVPVVLPVVDELEGDDEGLEAPLDTELPVRLAPLAVELMLVVVVGGDWLDEAELVDGMDEAGGGGGLLLLLLLLAPPPVGGEAGVI
jgi:hypothetical protein